MVAARALLDDATRALADAGIEAPRREARLLLSAALGDRPEALIACPEQDVAVEIATSFAGTVERRAARTPLAHILGRREFWSLDLAVTTETLIPRPDSEILVEAVLRHVGDRDAKLNILDLGTGSGSLLLALLSELPNASGVGVDRSAAAASIARDNARSLGLEERIALICGDWAGALAGAFDIVVSNPPYIRTSDLAGIMAEVRDHEPRLALDGGLDGLGAFAAILRDIDRLTFPGSVVALEVGFDQRDAVAGLMSAAGLGPVEVFPDLAGRPRVLLAKSG